MRAKTEQILTRGLLERKRANVTPKEEQFPSTGRSLFSGRSKDVRGG